MAIPSATSAFLEFDRKTGFQVRAHSVLQSHTPRIQRSVRLSLYEAAFGCTKRVAAMEAERRAWEVDVTIHAGTQDGAEVAPQDVQLISSVSNAARHFQFTVRIEKHPLFRLDRDRLSIAVPISIWRWLQGGSITVPTLQGSASASLPKQPSAILVPLEGWPEAGNVRRRKPLFVLPRIVFPEHLRHEEQRMLELLEVRSDMPEVKCWERHLKAWVESPSTDFG